MEKLTSSTSNDVACAENFIDYNSTHIKTEPFTEDDLPNQADPLLLQNISAAYIKQEPRASSSEFYGRIALEIKENGNGEIRSYKFFCDKCNESFSSLESFDEHINKNYLKTPKESISKQNEISITKKAVELQEEIVEPSKAKKTLKPSVNSNEDEKEASEDENQSNETSSSDSELEIYEPNAKRQKHEACSGKLSFDYPNKNCVVFFLNLLKRHAILWLRKNSRQILPFKKDLNDFISEFNTEYPDYNMTKQQLQMLVERFKTSYERACKEEALQIKYRDFLKLCAEAEMESKKFEQNCDLCKAVFYASHELQTHKFKRHKIGELPYKCTYCGYGFAAAETLASHEEKHKREKNFECEICGAAFYVESKLAAHRTAMHSEDRKSICEICGAVCADPTRYRNHKKSHEMKKEKCKLCNKSFLERWQLRDHMKAHQNKRSYVCNLCGKGFNSHRNLYIHKRGAHKMNGIGNSKKTASNEEDDTWPPTTWMEAEQLDEMKPLECLNNMFTQ